MKLKITFFLLLLIGTLWILLGRSNQQMFENSGKIFGTLYHIKYEHTEDMHAELLSVLQEVDTTFSLFITQSELSRFNQGEKVHLSPSFIYLSQLATKIAQTTKGAFDPTVAPLVNAWGFGFKKGTFPSPSQVDSLRQLVGYQYIEVTKKNLVKKRPIIQLDFGAIAKGYAVDRVGKALRAAGVKNYMIEIGGEVLVKGRKPNGDDWRIGIANPTESEEDIQAIITLSDCAMATSGNYRNFYIREGRKFAHTIDPRTGYPVQHSLLSATIIAPSCAEADGYATAFMVMGHEAAKEVLKQHKNIKAYFIYSLPDGKLATWRSEGFPKPVE